MAIKETVKGTASELKGKLKEEAGKLMNDPELVAKGQVDEFKGAAIKGYGETKDNVKEGMIKGLDRMKKVVHGLKDGNDPNPEDQQ